MEEKKMITEKQQALVNKIINRFDRDHVQKYISKRFPDADIDNLSREEAQKIITGLEQFLPRRPLTRVMGNKILNMK